jgi:hypothetical protein
MLNVGRTSFGRALAAVREKDYAAQILGVSTFRYKLLAFWVSSFIGGVVGSVLAVCYYARHLARPVPHRAVDPASRHGHRRRSRQRARLVLWRGADPVCADRAEQADRLLANDLRARSIPATCARICR